MAKKAKWIRALNDRRLWLEADARQALETWERSGLSMSAFMRQHGMSADRLRWWRKRLKAREANATGGEHGLEHGSRAVALAPLVPVMVTAAGHGATTVAVMFDDLRVEIAEPEAVGPTWVAELVHSLRRRG
jgi:hypothetical protein